MSQVRLRVEGRLPAAEVLTAKPPFRLPTMKEIRAVPWNGFNVVSLFSGAGGSCLGFRMAGFRTVWANEFIPAAAETYRANFPPPLPVLCTQDLRAVTPEQVLQEVRDAAGKEAEVDVLEGSPPCASFSTVGKTSKHWGQVRQYSETKQRVDDLFGEYVRIVRGVRPRAFVAENVSGLARGVSVGMMKEILLALQACGYRVGARLLDAQWLGVPQVRVRVILVGVRDDLEREPAFPKPLPYRYSIRDALPHVTRVVHDTSGSRGAGDVTDRPCPTVTVCVDSLASYHFRVECWGDASFEKNAIAKEWERLKPGQQSDRYFSLVRPDPDLPCPTVTQTAGIRSAAGVTHPNEPRKFYPWELRRICGFPEDFVLTGDFRQQWERLSRAVPPPMMYHVARVLRDEILEPSCAA